MAEKCIFRSKPSSNFVHFPNATARDKSLSFRARGLLVMVMSHSDEWVIHQGWLATQGQEGREAIRASMKELEKAGYAIHEEVREKGRIIGSRWTFYDTPQPQKDRTTKTRWDQPEDGKPSGGKPYDGKPSGGNPSPLEEQLTEDQGKNNKEEKDAPLRLKRDEVKEQWNLLPDLPHIRHISEGRIRTLNSRLKDRWWEENWREAIRLIPSSSFLMGKVPGRNGGKPFKADFDFFIQPDTVAKILEGKYHGEQPALPATGETPKRTYSAEDHIRYMENL